MMNVPYGKQNITEEDIQAVISVLKSDFLTQGPVIAEFERAFAKYVGSKYAVAVSNGTAALHLSALALDVGEGDKIITTPITFAASANCIRYCGGEVVFADIDRRSYLIDINKLRDLLTSSEPGAYTGIILVDFAGSPANGEAFSLLAKEFGLWIIEDACHAPGGFFTDSTGERQKCGNSKFADLSVFSFHPVKHVACGEGGMITTNNDILYKKLLKLRTHGITREEQLFENSTDFAHGKFDALPSDYPGWYMEMQELGYNYRLTDFQAALGLSQLARLDESLNRRRLIAERYYSSFKDCSFVLGQSGVIDGHAYHLYILEVENRSGLYEYLKANGVFPQVHYIPCHLMPYYRRLGWREGDLPVAEEYYRGCLSLPMYPTLTDKEQEFVIDKVKEFYHG